MIILNEKQYNEKKMGVLKRSAEYEELHEILTNTVGTEEYWRYQLTTKKREGDFFNEELVGNFDISTL